MNSYQTSEPKISNFSTPNPLSYDSPVINMDYQAAKPVDQRVIDQMLPLFTTHFGNPSSLHKIGDFATHLLEKSRADVAEFINAQPEEIVFTSGATEANNQALIGYALRNKRRGNHIIISEVEHISIHNLAKYLEKNGFSVTKIPVDQYGKIKVEKLRKKITEHTILISVQVANNEIGTIQPIQEVGEIAAERGIAFHTDAVAAEGLIPIDVKKSKINLLTLSSNDIYGPKGVGALYLEKGFRAAPILIGGGQENGLRSGSENLAGIVGFAEAAKISRREMKDQSQDLRHYRDQLIKHILEDNPHSYLNGHPQDRLPNNAHFRFDGIEGESILLGFKDQNIAVSTGSACSSKTLEPSHTLISTGLLHEEAHGSLELTTGRFTTQEEINEVIKQTPGIIARLRAISPLYSA